MNYNLFYTGTFILFALNEKNFLLRILFLLFALVYILDEIFGITSKRE